MVRKSFGKKRIDWNVDVFCTCVIHRYNQLIDYQLSNVNDTHYHHHIDDGHSKSKKIYTSIKLIDCEINKYFHD